MLNIYAVELIELLENQQRLSLWDQLGLAQSKCASNSQGSSSAVCLAITINCKRNTFSQYVGVQLQTNTCLSWLFCLVY